MKLKNYLWSLLACAALTFVAVGCSDDDDEVTPQPEPQPQPELTFKLEAQNVTGTTADLKVTPSAADKTYATDVLLAATLDKEGADKVIEMTLQMAKPEDLMKGTQSFKAEELKPETEYVLFAVGIENGKATSKLATTRFTTATVEPEPQPEPQTKGPVVELIGKAGNRVGEQTHSDMTVTSKCTSQDAVWAGLSIFDTPTIENHLKENNLTIEDFMKQNENNPDVVTKYSKEWLDIFNMKDSRYPDGLGLSLSSLPQSTEFWLILDARNAEGRTVVVSKASTTEPVQGDVKVINTAQFKELIWDYDANPTFKYAGTQPMVIDFFATWCGPCMKFGPTYKKLAGEYLGDIIFYQIDVDQNYDPFAAMANIGNPNGNIPFFAFVSAEGDLNFLVGAYPEDYFRNCLDDYCLGSSKKAVVPFAAGSIVESSYAAQVVMAK